MPAAASSLLFAIETSASAGRRRSTGRRHPLFPILAQVEFGLGDNDQQQAALSVLIVEILVVGQIPRICSSFARGVWSWLASETLPRQQRN